MKRSYSLSCLTLVATMTLTLSGFESAYAQQDPVLGANVVIMDCPDMAYETAYETPPEFVRWVLARAERINLIALAERQAMMASVKNDVRSMRAVGTPQTAK